jgi:hypothetical protein
MPRPELQKGRGARFHAGLQAARPLNRLRYLRRQLVETGIDTDDWSPVDSTQETRAGCRRECHGCQTQSLSEGCRSRDKPPRVGSDFHRQVDHLYSIHDLGFFGDRM